MKKLFILIGLIVTINLSANPIALIFTGWWTVGTAHFINFNPHGVVHDWERSGVLISISQDPTVRINQSLTDIKFKGGYKLGKFHPYIAYEYAGYPVYLDAYTVGCYYQFYEKRIKSFGNKYGVALKIGYETGMIKNQGQKVWTNGISLRGELWLRKHGVGFFGEYDYFTRPELTNPYVQFRNTPKLNGTPSGRLGVFWFLN